MRWYTCCVLDGKIHIFAITQRDGPINQYFPSKIWTKLTNFIHVLPGILVVWEAGPEIPFFFPPGFKLNLWHQGTTNTAQKHLTTDQMIIFVVFLSQNSLANVMSRRRWAVSYYKRHVLHKHWKKGTRLSSFTIPKQGMLQTFLCDFISVNSSCFQVWRVLFLSPISRDYFLPILTYPQEAQCRNIYGPINGTYILCLTRVSCKQFSSNFTLEEYKNTILW